MDWLRPRRRQREVRRIIVGALMAIAVLCLLAMLETSMSWADWAKFLQAAIFLGMALIIWRYAGLLDLLAIALALLALVPFAMSVYLFFAQAPILQYQLITEETERREGDQVVYHAVVTIRCQKGRGVLEHIFVAADWQAVLVNFRDFGDAPDPPTKHLARPDHFGLMVEPGGELTGGLPLLLRPVEIAEKLTVFLYPLQFHLDQSVRKTLDHDQTCL